MNQNPDTTGQEMPAPKPAAKTDVLENAARWLSAVFSPLLSATYGVMLAMWLSYLCYSPFRAKAIVVVMTFVATCVVPVIIIFVLSRVGVVKDPSLNTRSDRTVPYLLSALCYIGVGVYYRFVNAPEWLSMFVFGGGLALIILGIVNRYWKISAHAAGMGGLVAMLFFMMCSGNSVENMQWQFLSSVLLAGMVCTSRVVLHRHTLWQLGVGFVVGFVCVFLPAWFFPGDVLP